MSAAATRVTAADVLVGIVDDLARIEELLDVVEERVEYEIALDAGDGLLVVAIGLEVVGLVQEVDDLIDQLTGFPAAGYDDLCDALYYAVKASGMLSGMRDTGDDAFSIGRVRKEGLKIRRELRI